MNGNALRGSDARDARSPGERDEARSTDDDETRRAWAAAFGTAAPMPVSRSVGVALSQDASPAGWRPSDVSMTEIGDEIARAEAAHAGGAGGELTPTAVSRIETVVNGGEFGRVAFVVDRSNAGVSIVVEVESRAAAAAVDADKQTLLRTLRSAGITVLSFRILTRAGAGTALAEKNAGQHAKGASQNRLRYSRSSSDDDEGDVDPERVDVVG